MGAVHAVEGPASRRFPSPRPQPTPQPRAPEAQRRIAQHSCQSRNPQTIRHPERSGTRHGRGPRSRRTCMAALSITAAPAHAAAARAGGATQDSPALLPIPQPQTIRHPERSGTRHGRRPRSRRTCIAALSIIAAPAHAAAARAGGATQDSPALQCWESRGKTRAPEGRRAHAMHHGTTPKPAKTLRDRGPVSGHDFTGCGKTHGDRSFVSGHELTRAETVPK